jgi:hypothetical protein
MSRCQLFGDNNCYLQRNDHGAQCSRPGTGTTWTDGPKAEARTGAGSRWGRPSDRRSAPTLLAGRRSGHATTVQRDVHDVHRASTSARVDASAGVALRGPRTQNASSGRGGSPVLVVTTRKWGRTRMNTTGGIATSRPPSARGAVGSGAAAGGDCGRAGDSLDARRRGSSQLALGRSSARPLVTVATAVAPCRAGAAARAVDAARETAMATDAVISHRVPIPWVSAPPTRA